MSVDAESTLCIHMERQVNVTACNLQAFRCSGITVIHVATIVLVTVLDADYLWVIHTGSSLDAQIRMLAYQVSSGNFGAYLKKVFKPRD